MRRSRSKQSLTEKRLSPLTEDKLSLAEQVKTVINVPIAIFCIYGDSIVGSNLAHVNFFSIDSLKIQNFCTLGAVCLHVASFLSSLTLKFDSCISPKQTFLFNFRFPIFVVPNFLPEVASN